MENERGYKAIPPTCPENYRTSADYHRAFRLWNQVTLTGVAAAAAGMESYFEQLRDSPLTPGFAIVSLGLTAFTAIKFDQLVQHCRATLKPEGAPTVEKAEDF